MYPKHTFAASTQGTSSLVLLVCVGLIGFFYNHDANGQVRFELDEPFHDDFEDGNPKDGMPVTWSLLGRNLPESQFIENGKLITDRLSDIPEQNLSYVEIANTMLVDFSIRTQAIMLEKKEQGGTLDGLGAAVSLAGRTCIPGLGPNHVCGGEPEDFIYIDLWHTGEARTQQSVEHGQRIEQTDIRPLDDDFVMQFDAFGKDIEFWVWPAGEPQPDEPLIRYTAEDFPTLAEGALMFGTVYAKAAFDYVRVSDTPIIDLAGDFNFDFHLTASDMDMLTVEIPSPTPRSWFDVNGDDVVNQADREFWVESKDLAHTFFGDADLNGEVDFADFSALSNNFGRDGGWAQGDFDASGDVQFRDFLLLSSNYGKVREATLSQSVPEPDTCVLTVLSCCLCLTLQRRKLTNDL